MSKYYKLYGEDYVVNQGELSYKQFIEHIDVCRLNGIHGAAFNTKDLSSEALKEVKSYATRLSGKDKIIFDQDVIRVEWDYYPAIAYND